MSSKQARRNAVVDLIAEGEYDYASTLLTSQSRTGGAHNASAIYDNSAGTKDVLVSWARMVLFHQSAATPTLIQTAVIKLGPGETMPTWNSANIQKLRDEGKLFFLKNHWQAPATVSPARGVEVEFYNVKLRVGEQLQMSSIVGTTGSDYTFSYVREKRVLEVGT